MALGLVHETARSSPRYDYTNTLRHRRGLGIPASGLLSLAVVASELTLGATAYEGRGGRRRPGG
jgi:hypothetical protein